MNYASMWLYVIATFHIICQVTNAVENLTVRVLLIHTINIYYVLVSNCAFERTGIKNYQPAKRFKINKFFIASSLLVCILKFMTIKSVII